MIQKEIDKHHEYFKNKPLHFWLRDDIEEIIKSENIDRTRFHEFSKFDFEDIIRLGV